jgi:hypothetical protein
MEVFAAFADARAAPHRGEFDRAQDALAPLQIGERPWYGMARQYYDAYAWAIAGRSASFTPTKTR